MVSEVGKEAFQSRTYALSATESKLGTKVTVSLEMWE